MVASFWVVVVVCVVAAESRTTTTGLVEGKGSSREDSQGLGRASRLSLLLMRDDETFAQCVAAMVLYMEYVVVFVVVVVVFGFFFTAMEEFIIR